MGMPAGLGVIDLMLGIPEPGQRSQWYAFLKPNLRDAESGPFLQFRQWASQFHA